MPRLSLRTPGNLELVSGDEATSAPAEGEKKLKMLYCGICRTDARMWAAGHRDLVLPRVLGHEIAAWDEKKKSYCTVWPGTACGGCFFCREGRENLCDSMKIIGFHRDGGFAEHIVVAEKSIIYAPSLHHPELLCFAEPLGCIVNALSGCHLRPDSRVIIYGGGVLGMLAALCCSRLGARVRVIEHDRRKTEKIMPVCRLLQIPVSAEAPREDYDLSFNCCDAPEAFINCLRLLRKGGLFRFFSGLGSSAGISVDAVNLIHYKELEVRGCYGPKPMDMVKALEIVGDQQDSLLLLVEAVVPLHKGEEALRKVSSGMAFKYIIDTRSNGY